MIGCSCRWLWSINQWGSNYIHTFTISIHISQHRACLCGLRIIKYISLGIFLIIYFAAHNHLWNLPLEEKDWDIMMLLQMVHRLARHKILINPHQAGHRMIHSIMMKQMRTMQLSSWIEGTTASLTICVFSFNLFT